MGRRKKVEAIQPLNIERFWDVWWVQDAIPAEPKFEKQVLYKLQAATAPRYN